MANATIIRPADAGDRYADFPLSNNRKCIRVFDIEAASENEPIRGDLRVIDLEKRPIEDFTAISYVWGAYSEPADMIICGNSSVKVTANCISALRHLRNTLGSFTIWVDAICINQKDDNEKSHQIPLMDQVYSFAVIVYVWLGEGNEKSDRAMDYLAKAGYLGFFDRSTALYLRGMALKEEKPQPWAAARSAYMSTWTLHQNPFVRDSPKWPVRWITWLKLWKIPRHYYVSPGDLNDILEREWIRRIWAFQEILLASNPVVVCGTKQIPWSQLTMSIIFISSTENISSFIGTTPNTLSWRGILFSRAQLPKLNATQHSISESAQRYLSYRRFVVSLNQHYLLIRRLEAAFLIIPYITCLILGFALVHWWKHDYDRTKNHHKSFWFTSETLGILMILSFIVLIRLNIIAPLTPDQKEEKSVTQDIVAADISMEVCSRRATNPKDKNFALYAIFHRLTVVPPAIDYAKPTETIYLELSYKLLEATNSLQLLLPAALSRNASGPSWVANWGTDYRSLYLIPDYIFDRRRNNATLTSKSYWRTSTGDRLIVRGITIAKVVSRGGTFQSTEDTYSDAERAIHVNNLQIVFDILRDYLDTHPSFELDRYWLTNTWLATYYEEFILALKPDISLHHSKERETSRLAWWIYTLFKLCRIPASEAISRLLTRRRSALPSSAELPFLKPRPRDLLNIQIRFVNDLVRSGRTMILTGQGRATVGTTADDVQVGDEVVLVAGASMPLVMRRRRFERRIISVALLARIMRGNCWDERWEEGDLKDYVIN